MKAKKILIVEDDPALLRGLKDNFQAQGYLVRTANDGEKGLDALMRDPPDLLLLDLMLPKVNGYEICRQVRSRRLNTPIIMLSAKTREEDVVRGFELGADDYVTKPFGIRELMARARHLSQSRAGVPPAPRPPIPMNVASPEICRRSPSPLRRGEGSNLRFSGTKPVGLPASGASAMSAKTILIVEDDPVLLRGLKDNFEAEGHVVRTARDGQKGLDALLAEPPDLLLLDLMLPKVNGYEICRTARARQLDMPIIMLTAKGQEDDIVRGLELGADDYVTKPFSIRELLARVKAFLRRQAPELAGYEFGDYRLDLTAHKLFKKGVEIELTAKEFRLLEFFVKRAGRALTRDSILAAVWGDEVIVTNRSVDRCVTTLRGKIERDPRNPRFIQTIRDIGYRFEN